MMLCEKSITTSINLLYNVLFEESNLYSSIPIVKYTEIKQNLELAISKLAK